MSQKSEFQYTFEEFKEASEALQKRATKATLFGLSRGTFGWVLFAAIAVILILLLRMSLRPAVSRPAPVPASTTANGPLELILPVLPWLVIFALVWFFVFRKLRTQLRHAWDKHPDLHRPRVLEYDADGVTWSDQVSQNRRLWAGYTNWGETANLFLLYRGELALEFVPKRAFGGATDIQQFRELLRRNISPPQHAFPVVQSEAGRV